ncbi:MAG: 16S rRNA (guanine(527)-N(7))-methyltransferase RsmG, partial [Pseudomonadota bacterium]
PYLAPGGRLIFPKGARVDAELTSARKRWHMEVETRPSLTEAKAALLVIRKATRRHDSDG